jgi:hypothetical protein
MTLVAGSQHNLNYYYLSCFLGLKLDSSNLNKHTFDATLMGQNVEPEPPFSRKSKPPPLCIWLVPILRDYVMIYKAIAITKTLRSKGPN